VNLFDGADDNRAIQGSDDGRRRKKTRNNKAVEPGNLDHDAAREVGLRILTRTSKSAQELTQALIKKGATTEVATGVVERFIEVELIDDARLAKAIVNTRVALKGESARAISRELERRGLGKHADHALNALDREAELETAIELAAARLRRLAGLEREVQVRRLSGFLARKGYSGEIVGKAIREAYAQAKIEF